MKWVLYSKAMGWGKKKKAETKSKTWTGYFKVTFLLQDRDRETEQKKNDGIVNVRLPFV
jgi:hypothetical protein